MEWMKERVGIEGVMKGESEQGLEWMKERGGD